MITPEEIKLGIITFDKPGQGMFTINKTKTSGVEWSTEGPSGWKKSEKQKLSGSFKDKPQSLGVEVRLYHKESSDERKTKRSSGYVEMELEAEGGTLICSRELPAGVHREAIKINHGKEQKTVFVTFIIAYTQKSPLISLSPMRLDMGSIAPDKNVFKKIILTNGGKENLTWSVALRKHEKEVAPGAFQRSRYISFINDEVKDACVYAASAYLKDIVEFTGKWTGRNGYPSCGDGENVIKINFSGTGIILYLSSFRKDGDFALSLDKQPINRVDLFEDLENSDGELLIADNLADGPHVLTFTSKNNYLVFEGIKILGVNTVFFPENSFKIVPDSGVTTRQSNYLTVTLNKGQMPPGTYVDDIVFTTNGGEAIVEVFAEVLTDNLSKAIDIYRYFNGDDYLFTADPQPEAKRLIQNKYAKEGIAFRLFKPDTPGTVPFYRWYNPEKRSHFYHSNYTGGGKNITGYVYEGTVGNIATSRLTNTRELYRWYNPKTGRYFYTTDAQGGTINKKDYRFDGIAGYVK
jgi:hypothetical protein